MAKKNEINIFAETVKLPYKKISSAGIKKTAASVLGLTGTQGVSLSIIICDNEFIKKINSEFRKKNKPTDVISFAARESDFPSPGNALEELGEIYISIEKAEQQAVDFEVTLDAEIKRLTVHGILHLIGYDHERSKKDEKIMSSLEDELISEIL